MRLLDRLASAAIDAALEEVVEQRLQSWARWLRAGSGIRVGYPSSCPVHASMIASPGDAEYDDPDAQEMDRYIASLPWQLRRSVIAHYYLMPDAGYRQVADYLHIDRRTHRRRIDAAIHRLAVEIEKTY